MEKWLIVYKAVILGFIIIWLFDSQLRSESLLFFLLYISCNLTIYLFQKRPVIHIMSMMTIMLIIIGHLYIEQIFILLLPLNLCEWINKWTERYFPLLLSAIAPLIFIERDLQLLYGFISVISMVQIALIDQYLKKEAAWVEKEDEMRETNDRLTKSLLENAEFNKQLEYTIKLEERNRISQEIHDQIGHNMAGALIQMEAAKRLVDKDQTKAKELLQNAIHISSDGIDSIRFTLKNLKPKTEQIGVQRLKLMIDDFVVKHGVTTHFLYKGSIDLISPIQWKIIIENVKESLTNALKYSGATKIHVDIAVLNKLIKVVVKDNGSGSKKFTKGLGISGMEERAATVNGKVIIDGQDGFSVTLLLPIK